MPIASLQTRSSCLRRAVELRHTHFTAHCSAHCSAHCFETKKPCQQLRASSTETAETAETAETDIEASYAETAAAQAGAGDGVGVVAADGAGSADSEGSAANAFDAAQGAQDELQLLMAARREKLTSIELMGRRMHSELAAKMDVGVRVNPMLKNMYLSSNSNADESGGAASSGTEVGAAVPGADGGANTRVVDLLEAGSESDDGELGGCGPAAAAAVAADGSMASVGSRAGSTRDEAELADELDGGEAEHLALELLDF